MTYIAGGIAVAFLLILAVLNPLAFLGLTLVVIGLGTWLHARSRGGS